MVDRLLHAAYWMGSIAYIHWRVRLQHAQRHPGMAALQAQAAAGSTLQLPVTPWRHPLEQHIGWQAAGPHPHHQQAVQ